MAMTARRLAKFPELGLTLIAGRENSDRTITWAHAIELPDPTPYLSGGELVMTTGMNVGNTEADQFDYLARLSATGVAALAFDTGTIFAQVPTGIVSAGEYSMTLATQNNATGFGNNFSELNQALASWCDQVAAARVRRDSRG